VTEAATAVSELKNNNNNNLGGISPKLPADT
jgi:hypothetical protein